jgi:regulatory protein|tara:strand:+ start:19 stop:480 length:462 start_codon:yes stop_codon:yes gene_type:complete
MFQNKKIFDHDVAKDLIKKYCTYQDRCQSEVKMRLINMGLPEPSISEIISILISEGYLSEERFSRSFSRGKYKIKKWGRLKIKKHLVAKGISNRCVEIGISEIDENDYFQTLSDLISKYNHRNGSKNKYQLVKYFSSKGFEKDLIFQILGENE